MPKPLSNFSLSLLQSLDFDEPKNIKSADTRTKKAQFNVAEEDEPRLASALYRLLNQGLIEKNGARYSLTEEGKKTIRLFKPKRDGIWKLIIFDIPESSRYVRNVLRQRLQALGFKKWQNSIWVSPYALEPDLEKELGELGKKYFVRLIKTTDINHTKDLEELFPKKEG